jgi:hypothetical protein
MLPIFLYAIAYPRHNLVVDACFTNESFQKSCCQFGDSYEIYKTSVHDVRIWHIQINESRSGSRTHSQIQSSLIFTVGPFKPVRHDPTLLDATLLGLY